MAEINEVLLDLTNTQIRVLGQLGRNRRALIMGSPGTGKTILAVERARRLAESGFEVLLTCFNEPLSLHLQTQATDIERVHAMTFHSLCFKLCNQAKVELPREPDADWWTNEAPERLMEAAGRLGASFDAIVVDEGQDFSPEWLDALQLLLRDPDEGPFYLFADSQQALYCRNWAKPGGWPEFELDLNCRNTLPIAERVAAVYGDELKTLGTTGPAPVFTTGKYGRWGELVLRIADRLLTDGGLEPHQVTVLATDKHLVDELRDLAVSQASLVALGQHGVVCETVHRFKGLESDVIVLVLTSSGDTDIDRGLAYVGMSRARTMLFVLGTDATKEALGWPR